MEAEGPTAPDVHEHRLAVFRRSRHMLGGLINSNSDEVAIQHTTTDGINAVLFGMGLKPGDEIITCSGEHSSVIVPAYSARDRLGATLKIVRVSGEDSAADVIERFEEAATPALRLIVLSHVSVFDRTSVPGARAGGAGASPRRLSVTGCGAVGWAGACRRP